jgi:hypothetical protein
MKRFYLFSAIFVMFLAIIGCATVKPVPLSNEAAVNLKGKTCEISRHETPGFQASTADKAMLGPLLGVPLAFSEGKDIVVKNDIEDPAAYISQELAKTLNENLSVNVLPASPVICANSDIDTVCSTYKNGDIILDVKTLNWFFAYYPTVWTKYRVFYAAQFRLIDTKTKNVLAEEIFAKLTDEDTSVAPTYDDLLNNNAERLKSEIHKLADEAILHFRQKGLNI